MNLPQNQSRSIPGPNEPVALGIDPETLQTLRDLRAEYGDIVKVEQPNGRAAVFINDATEVRRLLVKNHTRYLKGPGFERVKMLLGNGLIVSDGDIWRRSRRMIQPAFSRQNVNRLIELMFVCTQKRVDRWTTAAEAGEMLNITQEMSDFALELILRSIFGADYELHIMASGKNYFAFLSEDSARDLRVVLQVRESRELILRIIEERRSGKTHPDFDFLSMYMAATDKDNAHFSDAELLDELITLIVAGYETSANTLSWAWYLLAKNPAADQSLVREATEKMSTTKIPNQETLTEMSFAQQLLEETLRLYPPVWLFTRRAAEDDSLEHYDIEAKTDIYLSPYILHRTAEYWPEPAHFNPERFATDKGAYKKGDRPYFPFSLGPRRCLGEYFSFLEMKVHLGLLIQKFRMTLATDCHPELDLGINLRSKENIFLQPVIR